MRDEGSIPGLGRSPRGGNGCSLQYSCLENPMDRGAWRATVHEVAQNWTRLSNLARKHTHTAHPAQTKQLANRLRSLCRKLTLCSAFLSFPKATPPVALSRNHSRADWPGPARKGSPAGDQRAAVPYHDLGVWCSHSGARWTSSGQRPPGSRSSRVWGRAATGTPGRPWAGPQRAACSPSHWTLKKHGKHRDILKCACLIENYYFRLWEFTSGCGAASGVKRWYVMSLRGGGKGEFRLPSRPAPASPASPEQVPHLQSTGAAKAVRHSQAQLPHLEWATGRAASFLGCHCVRLLDTHPTSSWLTRSALCFHSLPAPPHHSQTSICSLDAINPYSHPRLVPSSPVLKPNSLDH